MEGRNTCCVTRISHLLTMLEEVANRYVGMLMAQDREA